MQSSPTVSSSLAPLFPSSVENRTMGPLVRLKDARQKCRKECHLRVRTTRIVVFYPDDTVTPLPANHPGSASHSLSPSSPLVGEQPRPSETPVEAWGSNHCCETLMSLSGNSRSLDSTMAGRVLIAAQRRSNPCACLHINQRNELDAMKPHSRCLKASLTLTTIIGAALLATTAGATELVGFALMPANTFAEGPTSGQFAGPGAGGNALPLIDKQPVQGISAVLPGPTANSFYVMPDNGFGAKTNSADALLRIYAVHPDFKTWNGSTVSGSGTVSPVDFRSGRTRATFDERSFVKLRDPHHRLGFDIVADMA